MERQDDYYEEEVIGENQEYEEPEEETEEEAEIVEQEDGDEQEPIAYSHERDDGEEDEEEEAPKKKTRAPGTTRINELTREKYQALNEANRLQQENEYLKRMALESNAKAQELGDAAMFHHDKGAQLKLEHAKAKKFKAHEEGDIQAEIEADVDIANAANELQQISYWKTQQERNMRQQQQNEQYQQQYAQQQQAQPSQPDPQISYSWAERNSWFNPQSHDFDADLAQAARDYSEQVENYLYRNGRPDMIMSQEYYNEIDDHIQKLKSQRGQGMGKKQLTMRPVRGGAAPVRGTPSQSSRSNERHALSREEREIVKVMGIKEKDYLSQKLGDMRDHPERWANGGRTYGKG